MGLMSTENMGNWYSSPLIRCQEFTLEEGLLSAVNVDKSLGETSGPLHITDFTMQKDLVSTVNMGICSAKISTSFTKNFTTGGVLQMGKDFSKISAVIYP